jgi:hypothetical protein
LERQVRPNGSIFAFIDYLGKHLMKQKLSLLTLIGSLFFAANLFGQPTSYP